MAKQVLTPEQADALGITTQRIGRSEPIATQPADAALGFAPSGPLEEQRPWFVPTDHDLAALLGFDVATVRDPRVVQIANVDGGPLELRTVGAVEHVASDPGSVALRLGDGGLATLKRPVGPMVLLRVAGDEVVVEEIISGEDEGSTALEPISVEPLVEAPPCEGLGELALDTWSTSQIGAWLGDGSTYSRVAAVGLAARLALPQDAAAEVTARLAGHTPPRHALAMHWAQGLSDEVIRSIEERVIAAVDDLHALLATIEAHDPAEDGAGHAALVLRLCEGREMLACVEEVLRRTGRSARLGVIVDSLDAEAGIVVASLVRPRVVEWSPLLGRAAIGHGDAWWVAPLEDLPGAQQ